MPVLVKLGGKSILLLQCFWRLYQHFNFMIYNLAGSTRYQHGLCDVCRQKYNIVCSFEKFGNDKYGIKACYATIKNWGIFILLLLENVNNILLSKESNLDNTVQ